MTTSEFSVASRPQHQAPNSLGVTWFFEFTDTQTRSFSLNSPNRPSRLHIELLLRSRLILLVKEFATHQGTAPCLCPMSHDPPVLTT